jgi:peptidoglycan/LPS O-acetylase OafA/YrhL
LIAESAPQELRALTGLRFFAAFYVFIFHIHIRWPIIDDGFFANLLSQGAIGMKIFFMLSGFILAYRYGGSIILKRDYIVSRFARIYPIYAVALFTAIPALYFQIGNDLRFGIFSAIIQVVISVMTSILMIQAWFPMLFGFLNNSASWSLSVEAFFYMMFMFFIEYFSSLDSKGNTIWIFVLYIFALIPAIAYYAFENRPTHGLQIFYAMPIFRLSEFIIGVLIFFRSKIFDRSRYQSLIFVSLVIALFIYIGVFGSSLPIFVGHNWIVIPTVALALTVLSQDNNIGSRLLSNSISVWLGRISYCFYSFQFHVLLIVGFLFRNIDATPVVYFMTSFLVLLMVSAVAYHGIEEPARRRLLSFKGSGGYGSTKKAPAQ